MYVCVCVLLLLLWVTFYARVCMLLLRDGCHRGAGGLSGCGRRCRRGRLAGPFRFLLLDSLLDQVVSNVDGIRCTGDGDDAVPGARREDTLLGDLDVRSGQVLDLDQATAGGTWVNQQELFRGGWPRAFMVGLCRSSAAAAAVARLCASLARRVGCWLRDHSMRCHVLSVV